MSDAAQHHEDFGAMQFAMKSGGHHPTQAMVVAGGEGGKMLPFEGQGLEQAIAPATLDPVALPPLDNIVKTEGALSKTVGEFAGEFVNRFGAEEAKGDQGVHLKLGQAEISQAAAPQVARDLATTGPTQFGFASKGEGGRE